MLANENNEMEITESLHYTLKNMLTYSLLQHTSLLKNIRWAFSNINNRQ